MSGSADSLESLRTSFNRSLCVEGKAARTPVLYGQSIVYFSRWLAEQDQPADLTSLTHTNALKWLESLRERGQNTGTIRTRWRLPWPCDGSYGDRRGWSAAPFRRVLARPIRLLHETVNV